MVTDEKMKKELWQDWFIEHFPGGPTDPGYVLLKFESNHATYWIEGTFIHKMCIRDSCLPIQLSGFRGNSTDSKFPIFMLIPICLLYTSITVIRLCEPFPEVSMFLSKFRLNYEKNKNTIHSCSCCRSFSGNEL